MTDYPAENRALHFLTRMLRWGGCVGSGGAAQSEERATEKANPNDRSNVTIADPTAPPGAGKI